MVSRMLLLQTVALRYRPKSRKEGSQAGRGGMANEHSFYEKIVKPSAMRPDEEEGKSKRE